MAQWQTYYNIEPFDDLMVHNYEKWKSGFLTCPCHKIYSVEEVSLISFQFCLKNYDFSEYVEFGAISYKIDILLMFFLIKVRI